MPTVPVASNTVGLAEATSQKLQPADFGAAGEMIGKSLERLGVTGSDAADAIAALHKTRDDAAIKDAANGVVHGFTQAAYTGDNALFTLQGRDAQTQAPLVSKGIDEMVATASAGLKSPYQQQAFRRLMSPQVDDWKKLVTLHGVTEGRTAEADASASSAELSGNLGVNMWLQDPVHADKQIATGSNSIREVGHLKGWSEEHIQLAQLEFTSKHYQDIGRDGVATSGEDAPAHAELFLKQYGAKMTSDARDAVTTDARVQADHARAIREHQATVQQHAEEVQRTEARARAESVQRMITDGVNVPPQMLSDAQSDARTAKVPGLVEGLRQGGLKNNLTVRWANATPAQLTDRVNTLNAQITKAGGNVPADVMVERDHLQVLANSSESEIKTDGLSWGAKHLGVTLAPLNFADPHSPLARSAAAAQISRATHVPISPLTNNEAIEYGKIYSGDDSGAKVRLVKSFAMFGPDGAQRAGEQIAPNDLGFQNMLALATHQNQAVGLSRVKQVLAGNDVLKTAKALINAPDAETQFHALVGSALYFHPQVSGGVLENAKSILAFDANSRGAHDWLTAKPRFFAAVNSALGAYTKDGQQYGGLHSFNGGTTILPENMSENDFEARIARSNAPQLKGAHNGIPVYGDGTSPSSNDIKKMQWLPGSGGNYRLTPDGGATFLHRKGGGFYEIDVRKLR